MWMYYYTLLRRTVEELDSFTGSIVHGLPYNKKFSQQKTFAKRHAAAFRTKKVSQKRVSMRD